MAIFTWLMIISFCYKVMQNILKNSDYLTRGNRIFVLPRPKARFLVKYFIPWFMANGNSLFSTGEGTSVGAGSPWP
jgi:hypothetical protein